MLAWTGYSMIVREPLLQPWLVAHPPARFVIAVLVLSISLAPWWTDRLSRKMPALRRAAAERMGGRFATEIGAHLVEALRWPGGFGLAAGFVWQRNGTRTGRRATDASSRP